MVKKEKKVGLLKIDTKHTIIAIGLVVVAVFLLVASRGIGGLVGGAVYRFFGFLFGHGYYLLPVLLVLVGISYFRSERPKLLLINTISGAIFLLSGLGLLEIFMSSWDGGVVGGGVAFVISKLFGKADWIILTALLLISLIIVLDTKFSPIALWEKLREREGKEKDDVEDIGDESLEELFEEEPPEDEDEDASGEEEIVKEDVKESGDKNRSKIGAFLGLNGGKNKEITHVGLTPYNPPPLSLLGKESGKPNAGDIKANSNIIKRTLANFGIEVEMDEVSIGPTITRYALKPAEGVKLSKIVGLQNELALALAAHPLRVEAPIPGKSLVGVEVPNNTKTIVRLGSLLADDQFKNADKSLYAAFGKGISGAVTFADLAKMPHALIAGTTGSGKSVTIHSIITSFLYRNSPEILRFIMIDPKRVELTLYNNIPHLLTPVITQPKKAILSLKWAAKEMDRRYDILEAESVRDITSYHENILKPALDDYREEAANGNLSDEEIKELEEKLPEPMPYIVIVIDELADMMSTYPREMEAAIVRLAQMSRAVGIHLIISTQRPSTEIITGLIKANIPSRVALQVPSQIDSRTIIDMPGAEKLLGHGDMLYLSGEMSKPIRLQSAYISESEVKKVVKYIIDNNGDLGDAEVEITASTGDSDTIINESIDGEEVDEDDLYEEAREIVIQAGKASSSLLQRRLRVGYARAARLMDMLEERGVIGPGEGAKPRDVYEKASGSGTVDEFSKEFDKKKEAENDEK